MEGGGRGERQGRIRVGGGLTRATNLGDRRRTTRQRGSICTTRRRIALTSSCWHRAPYPSFLAPHLPPVSETTSFIAHLCWRTFVLQRPFSTISENAGSRANLLRVARARAWVSVCDYGCWCTRRCVCREGEGRVEGEGEGEGVCASVCLCAC